MTESPQVKIAYDAEQRDSTPAKSKRWPLFAGLAVALVAIGGAYYAYDTLYASKHVTTDNAYVGANVAQITPLIAAPVADVLVHDTQMVKKGDVLVRLDDTDARLQYEIAEAVYRNTLRRVRGYYANDRALTAQVAARQAEADRASAQIAAAEADENKARVDLDRRKALAGKGSVSGDELTAANTAYKLAEANLAATRAAKALAEASKEAAAGQRDANAALTDGTTAEDHPEVLAARAARDQAKVNLERSVVYSPVDGVVSRRQVQTGERVQPGQMLMVVVPLNDAYVDANFKEVQLAKVRKGQKVTLVSDLYGSDVPFDGTVVGLSGGTGAAFSIVPAQNATGNWIKVVQRLPVRIRLAPEQIRQHPLQVGLSMTADIHVE